jgi:uncharacterized protein involved in exopolysaccharide biosynthesis
MTDPNISPIAAEDEISLKELIIKLKEWVTYLLSKWLIIGLAGIIGASIGLVYALNDKPIYTATLSFVLEDEKSGGGGLSGALGLASQFGIDMGGSAGGIFTGTNLLELFKSRRMVEQTLLKPVSVDGKTISYAEWYIQNAQWRKAWQKKEGYLNIQFLPNADRDKFTRVQDSIMGVMYEDLSKNGLVVSQKDKKISIISVEVKSVDELFAQSFTEAIAKEVSDFYVQTKSKKANLNMAILERQTDSIRQELNGAITGVAVANDNTFGLNPALNVQRVPSARRQVDVQANTAILTVLVQQTEMAKVTLRKETPLIQVIDRPILPLKKEKFGKAKGILLGGFLAGFLIVLGLVFRKLIRGILV